MGRYTSAYQPWQAERLVRRLAVKDYRIVRRGPEDEKVDMLAGDGWILPRADAVRLGLIVVPAHDCKNERYSDAHGSCEL
jgi:hypothetical protein